MQKKASLVGANNFKVFTVLDNEFSSNFGITTEEMEKIIQDFEIQDKKEKIKKWYDGYTIGNTNRNLQPMEHFKLSNRQKINAILGKHKFK